MSNKFYIFSNKKNLSNVLGFLSIFFIFAMIVLDKMKLVMMTNLSFVLFFIFSVLCYVFSCDSKIKRYFYFISYLILIYIFFVAILSGFSSQVMFSGLKFFLFVIGVIFIRNVFYYNIDVFIPIIVFILLMFTLFIMYFSGWNLSLKMATIFYNPNSLGLVLSLAIFFTLFGVFELRMKYVYLILLFLFSIICMYTNSRTAVLSPFLTFFLWFIFQPIIKRIRIKKISKEKFFLLILKISALMLSIWILLTNTIVTKTLNSTIMNKFEGKTGDISSGRIGYITQSLEEIRYFSSVKPLDSIIVDNTFVAFAYDFGIIFSMIILIAVIFSFILLLKKSKYLDKKQACMAFVSLVNFSIYSNLESIRYSPQSLMFFLAFSFLISIPPKYKGGN